MNNLFNEVTFLEILLQSSSNAVLLSTEKYLSKHSFIKHTCLSRDKKLLYYEHWTETSKNNLTYVSICSSWWSRKMLVKIGSNKIKLFSGGSKIKFFFKYFIEIFASWLFNNIQSKAYDMCWFMKWYYQYCFRKDMFITYSVCSKH